MDILVSALPIGCGQRVYTLIVKAPAISSVTWTRSQETAAEEAAGGWTTIALSSVSSMASPLRISCAAASVATGSYGSWTMIPEEVCNDLWGNRPV